ncbi:MAG TPA: glycosyltransferase, partial [Candidatus Dormibacteraeota bacterium]|nr:glycosyltransferase [Candidatus Dormibacteraeota bacterium]
MSYLITAYYALAAGFLTLGILPRPIINSRLRLGLPVVVLALGAAGWVLYRLTGQDGWAINLTVITLGAGWGVRRLLPQWSFIASQLFAVLVLAGLCYLGYTVDQAAHDPLGPIVWVGSAILFCFELAVFCLGLSYAFELLDVLGRRDQPEYFLDADHLPLVVLQVPTYNEPVEVVERTLRSLGGIDYPNLLIQVVDNNTPDPVVWQPLRDLCASLGSRFKFIHLEPWPGYKAGALNEATRQLHPEVEIVGIVDADYVVRPGFLKATVPYFADPQVAFVQTPQHYRDWEDNPYLRGLFQSYRYFFDITMPARAHRNAIIFAGTMGLIRRSVLEGMGGWNPDTVTEDAEASLRMLGSGYNGVYVRQAWGEGLMPLSF